MYTKSVVVVAVALLCGVYVAHCQSQNSPPPIGNAGTTTTGTPGNFTQLDPQSLSVLKELSDMDAALFNLRAGLIRAIQRVAGNCGCQRFQNLFAPASESGSAKDRTGSGAKPTSSSPK